MKALFIVVATFVFAAAQIVNAQERRTSGERSFSLRVPRAVDTTDLSIRYFLTGTFGGYGSFVRTKPGVREYAIDASYEGKPAETLKAIIHCPGYGIELLAVPSPVAPSGMNVSVELKPLASIPLSGRVMLPEGRSVTDFGVEVWYLAYWGHEFFGIADGAVVTFRIGSTKIAEDGSFSIMVPDFARDPAVTSFEHKGAFSLAAREPQTGNIPYTLERAERPGRGAEVAVAAEYNTELLLRAEPRVTR